MKIIVYEQIAIHINLIPYFFFTHSSWTLWDVKNVLSMYGRGWVIYFEIFWSFRLPWSITFLKNKYI